MSSSIINWEHRQPEGDRRRARRQQRAARQRLNLRYLRPGCARANGGEGGHLSVERRGALLSVERAAAAHHHHHRDELEQRDVHRVAHRLALAPARQPIVVGVWCLRGHKSRWGGGRRRCGRGRRGVEAAHSLFAWRLAVAPERLLHHHHLAGGLSKPASC
jgi:hypothetical protein